MASEQDEPEQDRATAEEREVALKARQINDYLRANPDEHEVTQIAEATGFIEDEVRTILDEWRPTDKGIEHVGPGQGGPWIEPPAVPEVTQVGYQGNGGTA